MKKNEKKVPFFAQFLESQLTTEDQLIGGSLTKISHDIISTAKHPSDSDEVTDIKCDIAHTDKFPSDSDEVTSGKWDSFDYK